MSDFSIFAGDTKLLTVTVTDEAGEAVDITTASIKWQAARSVEDEAVIEKTSPSGGIEITDGSGGEFVVTLDAADTGDLSGLYYHEAEVTISSQPNTVVSGTFLVTKTLIRAA